MKRFVHNLFFLKRILAFSLLGLFFSFLLFFALDLEKIEITQGTEKTTERVREFWNRFPPTKSICQVRPDFWFCQQPDFYLVERIFCEENEKFHNQIGVCVYDPQKETEAYHPAAPGCNVLDACLSGCGGRHYWYEPYPGQYGDPRPITCVPGTPSLNPPLVTGDCINKWRDFARWQTKRLPHAQIPPDDHYNYIPPKDIGMLSVYPEKVNYRQLSCVRYVVVPPAPGCDCGGPWFEFKAENPGQHGTYIMVRACGLISCPPICCKVCGPWVRANKCGEWQTAYEDYTCGGGDGCGAHTPKPVCRCLGGIPPQKEKIRYYDHPLHPSYPWPAPETGLNPQNIYLPVKLDWDETPGWYKGFTGDKPTGGGHTGQEFGSQEEGLRSYVIQIKGELRNPQAQKKIDVLEALIEEVGISAEKKARYEEEIRRIRKEELTIEFWEEVLDHSEFLPPSPCFFKSNRTYQWRVKACCDPNGKTGCGPWSEWFEFYTNPTPEPRWPWNYYRLQPNEYPIDFEKYPFYQERWHWLTDPDWIFKKRREGVPKKEIEKLRWCEIDDPKKIEKVDWPEPYYKKTTFVGETYYRPLTYRLLIYYAEKDKMNEGEMPPKGLSQFDLCHPNLFKEGKCYSELLVPDEAAGERFYPLRFWDKNNLFFTKQTPYAWQVAACKDISGNYCTEYSQLWRFEAKEFTLDKPEAISPKSDKEKLVGLPVSISWWSPYAMSWKYQINGLKGETRSSTLSFDYPQLSLDALYSWKVQPCWDFETKKCEPFWSDTFYFKTTGRPPKLIYPASGAKDVVIPIIFDWEDVPGAKSYIFKIGGDGLNLEKVVDKSEFSLEYPNLKQETEYSWQVKTCAHREGQVCGQWSSPQKFKTLKIPSPQNPKPEDKSQVLTTETHEFSWEEKPGAKYYQFKIVYRAVAENEIKQECSDLVGKEETKIVSKNSIYYPLQCKGQYQWQVRGCLDEECQEAGHWSQSWSLALISPIAPGDGPDKTDKDGLTRTKRGLVPCGRAYNDPTTDWDETDPCRIEHIFLMLKLIMDFLLWRLSLIILALLSLATGVIFFFSIKFGLPTPLARVKALWKAAGIGYGIIFFAWVIVSFILTFFGYQEGLFGPWWKI